MDAIRITSVLSADAQPETRSVLAKVLDAGQNVVALDVEVAAIPGLITELHLKASAVAETLPDGQEPPTHIFGETTEFNIGMGDQGDIGLVIGFAGGGRWIIPMEAETIRGLQRLLDAGLAALNRQ